MKPSFKNIFVVFLSLINVKYIFMKIEIGGRPFSAVLLDNFFSRLLGLMFRQSIDGSTAYVLKPCNGIHSFFMRFPIDVIFIDKENRILLCVENMKPWRINPIVKNAHAVIEMKAGNLSTLGIKIDGKVRFL